jgi:BirA family biotin operon repressor/biotin-[acetyl-CoA-carboxylase] ligase
MILEAWRDRAQLKGRQVKVTSFGEILIGVAVDVDSDGALILEMADGKRKRVVAGDIIYEKQNVK